MIRRLHLLDATYEVFRAYYSRMPALRAPDGTNVSAVRGLLGSVLRLPGQPEVTHLGCATDHVIRSWRNREFAELAAFAARLGDSRLLERARQVYASSTLAK